MKGGLILVGGAVFVVSWAVMYNGLQWILGPPMFPFSIGIVGSMIPGSKGGDVPASPHGTALGKAAGTAAREVQQHQQQQQQQRRPGHQRRHVGRRAA